MTKPENTTRLCLIRHGETDWNAELRLQGFTDMPLNARGKAQADALGRALSPRFFDAVISSDLLRARQTAQPVVEGRKLTLLLTPKLRERNFGCCEGMTLDEVRVEFPEIAQALMRRYPDYAPPGGESNSEHMSRVIGGIATLAQQFPGKCIAVVFHGGSLEMVYRHVHQIPLEPVRDFPLPNASINWLLIRENDWVFESWGGTAHLGNIPLSPVLTGV